MKVLYDDKTSVCVVCTLYTNCLLFFELLNILVFYGYIFMKYNKDYQRTNENNIYSSKRFNLAKKRFLRVEYINITPVKELNFSANYLLQASVL